MCTRLRRDVLHGMYIYVHLYNCSLHIKNRGGPRRGLWIGILYIYMYKYIFLYIFSLWFFFKGVRVCAVEYGGKKKNRID